MSRELRHELLSLRDTRMLEAFQLAKNSIADDLVSPWRICEPHQRADDRPARLPSHSRACWPEARPASRPAAYLRKSVDRGGRSLAIRSRSDGTQLHPNHSGQIRPSDFGTERRLH